MRLFAASVIGVLSASSALAAAACSTSASDAGTCPHVFWHRPNDPAAHVEVIGDFNAWRRPGVRLAPGAADGYFNAPVDVKPGEQRYVFVEDGTKVLDRAIGTTAFEAGEEVSLVEIADCRKPSLSVVEVTRSSESIEAKLVLAGGEIDPASVVAEGLAPAVSGSELRLVWQHTGPGKKRVRVSVRDRRGSEARAWLSLWPEEFDLRDALVYQVIVDRYRGDRGSLAAPAIPSGRAGGSLRGLRAAIEEGELEGATALWVSPLNTNPEGEFPGSDGRLYSSYHGYWPMAAREVDPKLGSDDDLHAMVEAAHARGIRVILDVVPNHVHEQHPYAKTAGWTQGEGCTCGTASCDWGTYMESCRFAPYLPDLVWKNDDVARQVTADIADWVERFDLDGVRIDAVPMMPRAASRRIAAELRRRFEHPGSKFWVIGENYTGPDGYASLRYFIGPYGLDTEFHFPFMWALRRAIATGEQPMSAIADTITTGETEWAGSGAVMGLMIGNHDVPRFASVSMGDADGDGWSAAAAATDPSVYAKQLLALGLALSLPGAPFVYYGDEIGLVGRGDPDSRRVMPSTDALSSDARALRDSYRRLARYRTCSAAVRRGDVRFHFADRERLVFSRTPGAGEGTVLVVATRNAFGVDGLQVPLDGVPEGKYVDLLSTQTISVSSALTFLPGGPFSLHVFVREGDPCAS